MGCISQKDILRHLHLNLSEMTVEAVMDPEGIPMVNETAPVEAVIPLLQTYQAVVVQKQGRLTGIISSSDLLRQIRNGILVI